VFWTFDLHDDARSKAASAIHCRSPKQVSILWIKRDLFLVADREFRQPFDKRTTADFPGRWPLSGECKDTPPASAATTKTVYYKQTKTIATQWYRSNCAARLHWLPVLVDQESGPECVSLTNRGTGRDRLRRCSTVRTDFAGYDQSLFMACKSASTTRL